MLLVATLLTVTGGLPQTLAPAHRATARAALCQTVSSRPVDTRGTPRPHTLAQEPPAKEIKAVLYTEGGCIKPIVVREDIGARPAR